MRILGLALFAAFAVGCDQSKPNWPGFSDTSASAAPSASAPRPPKPTGPIKISGSSAMQPLIVAAKAKFEATHPGITVELSAGGSKRGLSEAAAGTVNLGASDLFAPESERGKLFDNQVAVIGFAAMANKGAFNEKLTALTLEQLADIFTGKIKDWKEVGGQPMKIVVIDRIQHSGTRVVFGKAVLAGQKFVEAPAEENSDTLVTRLKSTPGAISYLALSLKDPALWVPKLKRGKEEVEPNDENIKSGAWPIWSYEHLYTKGTATGATAEFLDYILGREFQGTELPKVPGFIPVESMQVQKLKD